MVPAGLVPAIDLLGTAGFLVATAIGVGNYRETDVERPLWLAFSFTAGLGTLWMGLVTLEWAGVRGALMDALSTSLQAVVIGLFAVGVVGTDAIVRDLKRSRVETAQRASLVSILSRVLRHNLRNDMTVIRGYTTRFADEIEDAAVVMEKIDDLLLTSEKARKLEQTVQSQSRHTEVDLSSLLERVVADVGADHPDVSVTTWGAGGVSVTVTPSFQTALTELVDNAAEHTADPPVVTLEVDETGSGVTITVIDNGPGLPAEETALLERSVETPLVHSSGIGLWVAQWIVATHGGSIDVETGAGGTALTVSIPADPPTAVGDPGPPAPESGYDRYHAIFENAADAVLVVDDKGRILDANDRAGELLGTQPEALLGRRLPEVVPGSLEDPWRGLGPRDVCTGTVAIPAGDRADRIVVYSATADILLGEHLLTIHHPAAVPDDA